MGVYQDAERNGACYLLEGGLEESAEVSGKMVSVEGELVRSWWNMVKIDRATRWKDAKMEKEEEGGVGHILNRILAWQTSLTNEEIM